MEYIKSREYLLLRWYLPSKIIEKVIKKHQKGYTAEATADMLEEPVSRIRQIYDVIEKSSQDYDAETIYKQLHEKEE